MVFWIIVGVIVVALGAGVVWTRRRPRGTRVAGRNVAGSVQAMHDAADSRRYRKGEGKTGGGPSHG